MISIQRNFWLAAVAISGGSHGELYGRHLCAIYLVLREVLSKSKWISQDYAEVMLGHELPRR
jgi:hypothetical protein